MKSTYILLPVIFMFQLHLNAQVQRNPVIEACTGTWCQWCPCGHDIIDNILLAMPNAIAIEYHGPVSSNDPWRNFPGNEIIPYLGFSGYPTGVIDRTGPPQSRGVWMSLMSQRNALLAYVDVSIERTFNHYTKQLNITINATAHADLTGDYKVSVLVLESGLVYPQTGNTSCPGGSNYVHNHVVRAMLNGALGESINNGNPWNTGETLSYNLHYEIPSDIVPENSEIVAFVYKVSSPLSYSEIQQAAKMELFTNDYLAQIYSANPDIITPNTSPAHYTTVVRNTGLQNDVYCISAGINGPAGWTGEFTTSNGTFPFNQTDSVYVAAGDSAVISVSVFPNGIDGYGTTTLQITSTNIGLIAEADLKTATTTGIDILIVDASYKGYADHIKQTIDESYSGSYALVSHSALQAPGVDISNFEVIAWAAGITVPVFTVQDVNLLRNYLDGGGKLFICGQDIGEDIFETTGQSQFAQSFYNNYLIADYITGHSGFNLIRGIEDDPIGHGIAFSLGSLYERSPDEIAPANQFATPVMRYGTGTKVAGLKAVKNNFMVVYFAFGMEQITQKATRDSIIVRVIRWFDEGVSGGIEQDPSMLRYYSLEQNYPNPFNPSTTISYNIGKESDVSLKVYDVMGAEVAELVNRRQSAGYYEVQFDASDLSSGVYFYRLVSGGYSSVKKMSILK